MQDSIPGDSYQVDQNAYDGPIAVPAQGVTAGIAQTFSATPPQPNSRITNVIPTDTFNANDGTIAPAVGTIDPENMLRRVAVSESLDGANDHMPLQHQVHLFGRSMARVFTISSLLIAAIIGVAALGVLHNTNSSSKASNQGLLSGLSGGSDATPPQQILNDSVLSINRNTLISSGKSLSVNGNVLIKSAINSASVFRIQNAAGADLLTANTVNGRIGIGQVPDPSGATLQVAGDISASTALFASNGSSSLNSQGLVINNVTVCTANGCKALGSSNGPAGPAGPSGVNGTNGTPGPTGPAGPSGVASCPNGPCVSLQAITPGVQEIGNINISGTAIANSFSGDGAALTNVDAASLQGENLAYFADAANLTSGTLSDSRLSTNVALLNANNTFIGSNTLGGTTTQTGNYLFKNSINSVGAFQLQNVAGNDNLLVGDTVNTRIGIGVAVPNYTLDVNGDINIANNQVYRINGVTVCSNIGCTPQAGSNQYVQIQASTPGSAQTGNLNITGTAIAGTFSGSGSALTSLNGTNISSGTVADARLSANVALLNGTGPQTFSGNNKFTGTVLAQNSVNSTTAFQVQSSGGSSILTVDTQNTRVLLPQATSTAQSISIGGDANLYRYLSGQLRTDGTFNSGGELYAQSGSVLQTGIGAVGPSSESGISFENGEEKIYRSTTNTLTANSNLIVSNNLTVNGTGLFKNSADSTTAFQIQNATSQTLFVANTSSQQIAIGPAAVPANGVLTIGTNTTAASGGIYFGTDTNLYRSAAGVLTTDGSIMIAGGSYYGFSPSGAIRFQDGGANTLNIYTNNILQLSLDASGNLTLGGNGLLVMGTKASDPTCTTGATYYNSTTNSFRGCQGPSGATAWMDLVVPPGTLMPFAGSSAPAGFFIADGTPVSRTTYSRLFAAIGTTYGAGDGSTTFNLPDFRGRTAVGLNTSEVTRTDVSALGNNEGAAIGSRTPYHKDTVVQPTISVTGNPTISVVQPTISVTANPTISVVQPTISVTGNPTITISNTLTYRLQTSNGGTNVNYGYNISGAATRTTSDFLQQTDTQAITTGGSITASASGGSYSATGGSASASGGSYSASGASATASGGSYSATGGTAGPQTNVPTDTGAYLTVNYLIKF